MKIILTLSILLFASSTLLADAPKRARTPQSEYERDINAVVRNKIYYKKGKLEANLVAGLLPYDSVIPAYVAGGRFIWHISDHIGWEVIDFQALFPRTGGFTSGLLQAHTNITNLQAPRLKMIATTNLLVSPLYGKIHIGGSWSLFFDLYLTLGVGAGRVETVQFGSTGSSSEPSEAVIRTSWDFALNVGVGFKIFMTDSFGLSLELRDYIVNTPTYGNNGLKSFFSTMLGLSFYLPSFG